MSGNRRDAMRSTGLKGSAAMALIGRPSNYNSSISSNKKTNPSILPTPFPIPSLVFKTS